MKHSSDKSLTGMLKRLLRTAPASWEDERRKLKAELARVKEQREAAKRNCSNFKQGFAELRAAFDALLLETEHMRSADYREKLLKEAASGPMHIATDTDIKFCYRLLLHRECTPEELSDWNSHPRKFSVAEFTHRMICHPEHRALLEQYRRPLMLELDAFRLYVRQNDFLVGQVIAQMGYWEPHVITGLRKALKPGSVFVDIGANVGYITMFAAKVVGQNGKVLAFEPNPGNCELLALSVQANQFSNVELYPCAVSDVESVLTLHADQSSSLGLLLAESDAVPDLWKTCYPKEQSPKKSSDESSEFRVRAAPLDVLLEDESRIDVVKIDTDGHEPRVLDGMKDILKRHRPILFVEFFPLGYHVFGARSAEVFLNELRDLGYHICNLNAQEPFVARSNDELMACVDEHGPGGALDLMAVPHEVDSTDHPCHDSLSSIAK